MRVELSRFRVRPGRSAAVDEWMHFLNANLPAVLETLDGEKMYIEAILRERRQDGEYLYWFTIQGDHGLEVTQSEHWLDKKHLEYWKECIDPEFGPEEMTVEALFIPERIKALMPEQ